MNKDMFNDVRNINKKAVSKDDIKYDIKNDFKNNKDISNNTSTENNLVRPLKLKRKVTVTDERKSFLLYMNSKKLKKLDKLVAETNYSRNELLNILLDYAMENVEF